MAFGQPAGSPIKSIQSGTIAVASNSSTSGTATITAVVVAKSFISYLGWSAANQTGRLRIGLTNTTTVTVPNTPNDGARTVAYEVIEYN
jgi:hypothetical protein